MRRLPETGEAFARRKAADLARWRRNAEEDCGRSTLATTTAIRVSATLAAILD
jgi:hypothetical protein